MPESGCCILEMYKHRGSYDEADDPGALAAVGCLRAISTIIESVSRLPHLFEQIEPTLFLIMRRMLTSDGQDVYEEVLEIVSYMTFYSPKISMNMWSLWPLMMEALADWTIDYFPNILVPLDNYISRSTEHFLTCKEKVMTSMEKPSYTMRVPRKSEPDYYLGQVLPVLQRRRVCRRACFCY